MDKSELLEEVLDRYDIRFNHTYNGWQTVQCPNEYGHSHGDKNPSARVNMTHGMFACMGCELKGDGYTILMEIEHLTFLEAKEQLGSVYVKTESNFLL